MEQKFGKFGELGTYETTPVTALAMGIYKNVMELVNANDQKQALEALKFVYGFSKAAVKETKVKEAVATWPERKKALGY